MRASDLIQVRLCECCARTIFPMLEDSSEIDRQNLPGEDLVLSVVVGALESCALLTENTRRGPPVGP